MNVYTVLDVKAGRCAPPFLANSDAEARRLVAVTVVGSGTLPDRFPADFNLLIVGTWDDATGNIVPCQPSTVANLATIIEAEGVLRQKLTPPAHVVDDAPESEVQK